MTDPIADMLTRIRNAVSSRHPRVDMPASKLKAEIARILQDEGYIRASSSSTARPSGPGAPEGHAGASQVRPRRRAGHHRDRARQPARAAASTSGHGKVPHGARGPGHQHPDDLARRDDRPRQAQKAGVGGEVLCNVW
jgi:small subunit ribosomal protein S8